jgi:hypothetical protein
MVLHVHKQIPLFGLEELYCTSCAVELWIASLRLQVASSHILARKSAFRAWMISGHVLEKGNLFPSKYTKHPRKSLLEMMTSWNTPMYVVTRKVLVRLQLRNLLQVETCSIYARNVNFEELNFGPHKNDYTTDHHHRPGTSVWVTTLPLPGQIMWNSTFPDNRPSSCS